MRRTLAGLLLGFLGFSFLVWAGPKLAVSEVFYDFGEVKEGILVVHNFILTNVGDAVLNFPRLPSTSCGCTTAPLPKNMLLPGESVALEVRFETTGYGGHRVVRYVYVYSDDPETPQLTLAIQGTVLPCEPYEDTAYMLRYRYRLILDVREREAFSRGHLLGAVNVPAGELEKAANWLPQTTIYVCDEAGEIGLSVAESLRRLGFWAVRVLSGGLAGWTREFGSYLLVGEAPEVPPILSSAAVPAARLAQEYVIILDFREDEAFSREHLVGSIHVGPTGLDAVLNYLLPAASLASDLQPYIFCVDEGEGVAQEAAQFLQSLGLARAKALVGGLDQWRVRYGSSFLVPQP